MIKSVIFDCFGVLTEDGWLAFAGKYRTPENEDELSYLNHQLDKGLVGYADFLNEVCAITRAEKSEAHRMITTSHHPNEPLFEYIRELKTAGYSLGVISNVGSALSDSLPQELVDLFDHITLSYEVGAIKPDPAIYRHHLAKVGCVPGEAVFIDDRAPNVEAARALGMSSFVYRSVPELVSDLETLGIKTT